MTATLHHELVAPTGAAPAAWIVMTHGIFGSGANWRSIARKLVERRPRWGAVLVDLRAHGRSDSGDPPHTIEACAEDLAALDRALHERGRTVRAACGHSFGGKVVLALRALGARPHTSSARAVDLLQTWVLDATPSARPELVDADDNSVRQVLSLLERMPAHFARRDDFVAAVRDAGHGNLASWLAMNLEPTDDAGFRIRLDLPVVRALLVDYYKQDLWRAVEDPAMPGELHVVVAGRSTTVPAADRERLSTHQSHTGLTCVHLVPGAGHWVHADAPDDVVELLAGALPSL